MILLVDTSVWADHIVKPDQALMEVLARTAVRMHPFVIGELAMGTLHDRRDLASLDELPKARIASNLEVRYAVERHELWGTGLQYVDAHLLVSTLITAGCYLHTRDKRLAKAAARMNVFAEEL